jgi:putative FmdB family regulatory protein
VSRSPLDVNLIEILINGKYISSETDHYEIKERMPTYEYRCKSCGHEFEEFESMSADPLIMCPKCAKPSLKRLMSSGAGLVFKGSGFYLTDYKKSNTSAGSKTSSGSKTEPKTDSKSESKPAASKDSPSSSDTSSTADKK